MRNPKIYSFKLRNRKQDRPRSLPCREYSPIEHLSFVKSAPEMKEREPLSGPVERVTFHSGETGFCVLRVKVRGQRDLVTVLAALPKSMPASTSRPAATGSSIASRGRNFVRISCR